MSLMTRTSFGTLITSSWILSMWFAVSLVEVERRYAVGIFCGSTTMVVVDWYERGTSGVSSIATAMTVTAGTIIQYLRRCTIARKSPREVGGFRSITAHLRG